MVDIEMKKAFPEEIQAGGKTHDTARVLQAFHNLDDVVITTDDDLRVTSINRAAERLYTANSKSTLGHSIDTIIDISKCDATWDEIKSVVSASGTWSCDIEHIKANGEAAWVAWSVSLLVIPETGPAGMISVAREITERKQTEEALRKSEERYRTLVDKIQDGVFTIQKGRLLFTNDAFARMIDYSPEELIGKTIPEIVAPEDIEMVTERYQARLSGEDVPNEYEFRFVHKDGRTRTWVRMSVGVYDHPDGLLSIGTVKDITDQKHLERSRKQLDAQLRHQQKLESIGTLAGGVAHEINNPINIIMNYGELIQKQVPCNDTIKLYAGEVISEGNRIADIVRNLLAFARQENESHSPATMYDIVSTTLSLTSKILKKDQIRIESQVPKDLPKIKCRSQQIQQVLMNLITNARDALNERFPGYHDDKVIHIHTRPLVKNGEPWIRTSVTDYGSGIAPENIDRIFDPFFTTKACDQGTGLGLSVSHGIMKEHMGVLSVESRQMEFTRFHMDLAVDNGWMLEAAKGGKTEEKLSNPQ